MTMHACPFPGCVDDAGQPVMVDGTVCDPHRLRAAKVLAGLPRLYVELSMSLAPDRGAGGEQVSVSRTPPLPLSVERRSLIDDICFDVAHAERGYRHARGLTPTPRRGREGPTLAGGALYLRQHLDTLLGYQLGVQAIERLDQLTRQARRALGLTRLVNKLAKACPACGHQALERADGSDRIECRYCGLHGIQFENEEEDQ